MLTKTSPAPNLGTVDTRLSKSKKPAGAAKTTLKERVMVALLAAILPRAKPTNQNVRALDNKPTYGFESKGRACHQA